jgi:hypothetical protein
VIGLATTEAFRAWVTACYMASGSGD